MKQITANENFIEKTQTTQCQVLSYMMCFYCFVLFLVINFIPQCRESLLGVPKSLFPPLMASEQNHAADVK